MDMTVDRRAFSIAPRRDAAPDLDYWLAHPVSARIDAIEIQRRIVYGSRATARLQRVFEVSSLSDLGS